MDGALQFLKNTYVVIGGIVALLLAGAIHYRLVLAEQKNLRRELEDLQAAVVLAIDIQRVTVPLLACNQPLKGDLRIDMELIRCKAAQGDFQPLDVSCKKADDVSKLTRIEEYGASQEADDGFLRCDCKTQEVLANEAQVKGSDDS